MCNNKLSSYLPPILMSPTSNHVLGIYQLDSVGNSLMSWMLNPKHLEETNIFKWIIQNRHVKGINQP